MPNDRAALEQELMTLLPQMVFGTLADTYRRCGRRTCRCYTHGEKHGPFMALTWRGPEGKTKGHQVPKVVRDDFRAGVAAWHRVQEILKALALLNKEELLVIAQARKEEEGNR